MGDYAVGDVAGALFTNTYRDVKIRGKRSNKLASETGSVSETFFFFLSTLRLISSFYWYVYV